PARELAGQVGGEWKRTGRLERQVNARPRDLDGGADLVLRHGDDLVHKPVTEHDLEVTPTDSRRADTVGDRFRGGRQGLDAARFPGPEGVGGHLRLDAYDAQRGVVVLGGDGGTGQQSAAAAR